MLRSITGVAEVGWIRHAARGAVWIAIALAAINAVIHVYLIAEFSRSIDDPYLINAEFLDVAYGWSVGIGLIQLAVLLLGGVASIAVFYRLAKNGALIWPTQAHHKSHWAIWGWVVPILSLFRPYQMAKQIWVTNRSGKDQFGEEAAPRMFATWWTLWIAGEVYSRVLLNLVPVPLEWDDYLLESIAYLGASLLTLAAATAYLLVLNALLARHRDSLDHPWVTATAATPTAPAPIAAAPIAQPGSWPGAPPVMAPPTTWPGAAPSGALGALAVEPPTQPPIRYQPPTTG